MRTSLEDIAPDAAVEARKSHATVERAKTDLGIRPVCVTAEDHVRGHVLPSTEAWYVEWHMRQALRRSDDRQAARRQRTTAVKKAQRPPGGLPVHSLRTLIDDLSSVIRPPGAGRERATIVTRRTRLQSRAFELPEINPDRTVPMDTTGRDHGPQPDNRVKSRRWKQPVHLRPDEVPADSGALQPVNGQRCCPAVGQRHAALSRLPHPGADVACASGWSV
ncbi:MAG: hypothetical protein OXD40_09990 [bacterium]|nr:hypothetical protein [bacterium]